MSLILLVLLVLVVVGIAWAIGRWQPLQPLLPSTAVPAWRAWTARGIAVALILTVVVVTLASPPASALATLPVTATVVTGASAGGDADASAPEVIERVGMLACIDGETRVLAYAEARRPRDALVELRVPTWGDLAAVPGYRLHARVWPVSTASAKAAPAAGPTLSYELSSEHLVHVGWWHMTAGETTSSGSTHVGPAGWANELLSLHEVDASSAWSVMRQPLEGMITVAIAITPVPSGASCTTVPVDALQVQRLFPQWTSPYGIVAQPRLPTTDAPGLALVHHLRLAGVALALAVWLLGAGVRHPSLTRSVAALGAVVLAILLEHAVVHRDGAIARDPTQPLVVRAAARAQAGEAFFTPEVLPLAQVTMPHR